MFFFGASSLEKEMFHACEEKTTNEDEKREETPKPRVLAPAWRCLSLFARVAGSCLNRRRDSSIIFRLGTFMVDFFLCVLCACVTRVDGPINLRGFKKAEKKGGTEVLKNFVIIFVCHLVKEEKNGHNLRMCTKKHPNVTCEQFEVNFVYRSEKRGIEVNNCGRDIF